jgi:hypothetical protein
VALFGKANWWLPAWVAKVLRIKPEPVGHVPDQGGPPALEGFGEHAAPVEFKF